VTSEAILTLLVFFMAAIVASKAEPSVSRR